MTHEECKAQILAREAEKAKAKGEMVQVPRELLERVCMRPSKESLAVNHADIVDRGRAQAELRELLAAPARPPKRNQCDGCQAGIPVVNGAHRMGKPDGYPDTMSCTAKMYVEERPDGCCCPPKGHTGLWAAAMCPVHQGLRALKR